MSAVVSIDSLTVSYETHSDRILALDEITLSVAPGECFGVVGESGCGKSTLSSVLGHLLAPNAIIDGGSLSVAGKPVLELSGNALRSFRQQDIAYVFQDPISVLDPTKTIGGQFRLVVTMDDWRSIAEEALRHVGLLNTSQVLASYPHQLSGGMAQRAVIALALVRSPKLLIADEPTAALDASIRRDVMNHLTDWCSEIGAALIIVSHDVPLIAQYCERIGVIYAGRFVEIQEVSAILSKPEHPYTRALLAAEPGNEGPDGTLFSIAGSPPLLQSPPVGCAFAPRCSEALDRCRGYRPELVSIEGGHTACHNRVANSGGASR